MARPQKKGADWFHHDSDASASEKIEYLEALFGLEGYAVYFKLLEILAASDDAEIQWDEMRCKIIAHRLRISAEKLNEIIVAATIPPLNLFRCENGVLFSPGLKKRLRPLAEKREQDAERQKNKRNGLIVAATTPIVAATSTQSREEKRRVYISSSSSERESEKFETSEPEEKAPPVAPPPPAPSFQSLNAPEVLNGFRDDFRVKEAFTMTRKLPPDKFDDCLQAFTAEVAATQDTYWKRADLVRHFLNYSESRIRKSAQSEQKKTFNHANGKNQHPGSEVINPEKFSGGTRILRPFGRA